MKGAFRLGRFAGIDVFVHLTFFLLLGWVALVHWQHGRSLSAALAGVMFIIALFVCVLLHEYGHALMARRYGISTRDIILLPMGGVARLERLPTQPGRELRVAFAGPAVNAAIAVLLYGWLKLTAAWEPFQSLTVTTGPFLERLMAVNLLMIAFNLLPAFPMDGGRVLRAILATRMTHGRATRIAASIGRGFAVFFGLMGLFYSPLLILIAFFVWVGAGQEAGMAQLKSAVGNVPVHRAMVRDFKTLAGHDSLKRAVELTLAGSQKDFPVVKDGILEGVLRRNDLLKALAVRDARASVAALTRRDPMTVDAADPLDSVAVKLIDCECHALPVTRGGKLVGLVTADNISEFMRIGVAAPANS